MKIKPIKPAMAILALGMLTFYACKKDRTIITTDYVPVSNFNSLSAWSKSMAPAIQNFTVNLTTGGTVVGDRGYRFYFAPGSLVDGIGNPITGNVDVKLQEVTTVAEMLATGAKTEAVDGVLASAGMFNLQLSKSGQEVYINPSKPVKAEVMAKENVVMTNVELLEGFETTNSKKDSVVRWNRRDSVGPNFKFNIDSMKNIYDSLKKAYERRRCIKFDLPFGRWCNLDRYINNPSGNAVRIKAEGTKFDLDTRVFMYIKTDELTGFYELFQDLTDPEEYNSSIYNLPTTWQMTIVVVTRNNKKEVKYESRVITNTKGTVHTFNTLKGISDLDLEAFFKNL